MSEHEWAWVNTGCPCPNKFGMGCLGLTQMVHGGMDGSTQGYHAIVRNFNNGEYFWKKFKAVLAGTNFSFLFCDSSAQPDLEWTFQRGIVNFFLLIEW